MKHKSVLIVLLFSCFTLSVNAQLFQWAGQFECPASIATDVVTDHADNVISTGWFQGPIDLDPGLGGFDPTPPGQIVTSSYISKLNPNGNMIWGFYYTTGAGNTLDNVRLHSVDVDAYNNIVVMGMYRDSVNLDISGSSHWAYDPTPYSSEWDNIFIVKYSPNGNYMWSKTLHSTVTTNGYGLSCHKLLVDNANNIVLSGRFNNTVDFDPSGAQYNLTGPTVNSFFPYGNKFLLKLDSLGNFMWVRNWAETENWVFNDFWYGANELDVDLNNDIYLPISFIDTLDVDPLAPVTNILSKGEEDIALVKISSTGSLLWYKQIGDTAKDFCNSLATDLAGNIFYTLRTYSGRLDVNPGVPVSMFYWPPAKQGNIILKLDSNGDYLWAKKNVTKDSTSFWWGEGIATNSKGALYLTTKIESGIQWDLDPGLSTYMVSSAGSDDIALQNLDSNGHFIWGGVMGGSASDWSYNICTDTGNGVYLSGHFYLSADFDPSNQSSIMMNTGTSYDAFVVKLNNCNKATTQLEQHCDSVYYNGIVYQSDTVLQTHYTSLYGCDSVHSILIDVTKNHDTIQVDTCKYYIWNGNTYITSGVHTQHYGIVNGCDSSVTLDLTIHNDTTLVLNINDCDSTVVNGISYYQSGTYYQYYNTSYGCDSDYVVHFTKNWVDTSLSWSTSTTLSSNAANATYQWLDCNTMQIIPGATNATYTPSQTGSYACIVTQNGCADTSGCWIVQSGPAALYEYSFFSRIYPNPSDGKYMLEFDKDYSNVQLEIRTMSGKLVWEKSFEHIKDTELNIECASGIYMLQIKQNGHTQTSKLVKW